MRLGMKAAFFIRSDRCRIRGWDVAADTQVSFLTHQTHTIANQVRRNAFAPEFIDYIGVIYDGGMQWRED